MVKILAFITAFSLLSMVFCMAFLNEKPSLEETKTMFWTFRFRWNDYYKEALEPTFAGFSRMLRAQNLGDASQALFGVGTYLQRLNPLDYIVWTYRSWKPYA